MRGKRVWEGENARPSFVRRLDDVELLDLLLWKRALAARLAATLCRDHPGLVIMVSIAISALGLLVGGIGVMNIMLVTVTERTREIGVRKAIGARRQDIVAQFLVEAMALTGAGGLLGIALAVGVTLLIGALVPALPSEVPPWAIITALTVSVSIGLFFGVWPALKASRLDPVEALRYE